MVIELSKKVQDSHHGAHDDHYAHGDESYYLDAPYHGKRETSN